MTGQDAIRWAEALAPNAYSTDQKLAWLSDLDGKFYREFLSRYEGVDDDPPAAYEDGNEDLLIPEPYARDVYGNWLLAKIAEANQETLLYNQYSTLFNAGYREYCDLYNRNHVYKRDRCGRSWIW
jgi:hypothetical protein